MRIHWVFSRLPGVVDCSSSTCDWCTLRLPYPPMHCPVLLIAPQAHVTGVCWDYLTRPCIARCCWLLLKHLWLVYVETTLPAHALHGCEHISQLTIMLPFYTIFSWVPVVKHARDCPSLSCHVSLHCTQPIYFGLKKWSQVHSCEHSTKVYHSKISVKYTN